jgi:hypothetical protein
LLYENTKSWNDEFEATWNEILTISQDVDRMTDQIDDPCNICPNEDINAQNFSHLGELSKSYWKKYNPRPASNSNLSSI